MPLLVARGVSRRFGAVEALVDADFDVDGGEVVALVGDNGAGKSTLIKAIAGVQPAVTGESWIDGRLVSIRTPRMRRVPGVIRGARAGGGGRTRGGRDGPRRRPRRARSGG